MHSYKKLHFQARLFSLIFIEKSAYCLQYTTHFGTNAQIQKVLIQTAKLESIYLQKRANIICLQQNIALYLDDKHFKSNYVTTTNAGNNC